MGQGRHVGRRDVWWGEERRGEDVNYVEGME